MVGKYLTKIPSPNFPTTGGNAPDQTPWRNLEEKMEEKRSSGPLMKEMMNQTTKVVVDTGLLKYHAIG